MTEPLLQVSNVGKSFRQYHSEWRRVASWFGIPARPAHEQWVLRNVSFAVQAGESLGILGRNGAGKSTLLKMITGTQRPVEGQIQVNGRTSAILELGMGFNPEFTGRQNVIHGLGLMGVESDDIKQIMPELEMLAEIGDYFDQPVRTYSSGMQMRLAFAVATAFRPDLLIIDEALSVGDAYYQHKSFNRIREFLEQGTSLLLVSHDNTAIQSICSRALLIDEGRLIKDGSPAEVSDYYNAMIAEREADTIRQTMLSNGQVQTISGSGEAVIKTVELFNSQSLPVETVNVGEQVTLVIEIETSKDIDRLVLGYMIRDRLARPVYGTSTQESGQVFTSLIAGKCIRYEVTFFANLGPGSYSVSVALSNSGEHVSSNYEWRDLALVFTVENRDRQHFVGLSWLEPSIVVNEKN